MADLHVFTDDADTCIAASLEDALDVMSEYGYTRSDLDPEVWEQVDPGTEITIHCDHKGNPATPGDDGVDPVTRTAAEWIALRGRGFLCTTEF